MIAADGVNWRNQAISLTTLSMSVMGIYRQLSLICWPTLIGLDSGYASFPLIDAAVVWGFGLLGGRVCSEGGVARGL